MNLLCLCRRSKPTQACPNTGRPSMNWTMLKSVQKWRKWPWIKWGWGTEPPPLRASPRWRSSRSASLLAEDRTSRGGKRHTHTHASLAGGQLKQFVKLIFSSLTHTTLFSVSLSSRRVTHTRSALRRTPGWGSMGSGTVTESLKEAQMDLSKVLNNSTSL